VKIIEFGWRAYCIPLRREFVTSAGARQFREGFIIRLQAQSGLYGLGEIAPLNRRTIPAAARALTALTGQLAGTDLECVGLLTARLDLTPDAANAIRCGLDIAACDLIARQQGISVAKLIAGSARDAVPVNATISARTPGTAAGLARRAVQDGFGCIKLKAGMTRDPGSESEMVGAVRDAVGPNVLIRLDINGAWSVQTAIRMIRAVSRFGIEYVEQPVAADDVEGLAAVRTAVNVPIAADEAVTNLDAARLIIDARAADLLILKPMIVGGLRPAMAIAIRAAEAGIESVITTTIDSGVAIAAAAHLACAAACTRACGLATAELLESDLAIGTPHPRAGMMACPAGPGLGVEIDEAAAAPYLERT